MGTRNVTIIKYKGKEMVRQYGQWDGYPTGALASIVNFLHTDGAIEKLKQNLLKVELVSENISIYPKEFDAIARAYYKIGYISDVNKKINKLAEEAGFAKEAIFKYLLATRDTGFEILSVLILDEASAAERIVLQKAYTDKVDWQIEAVNIIDLDRECVRSYWHGAIMREYSFDALPSETEIEEFEQGGY